MKLYSFGDSFTQGLGTDRKLEHKLMGEDGDWDNWSEEKKNIQRTKVSKLWIENSFTHMFANKLKCQYRNFGHNGSANMDIVEMIVRHSHLFEKGDLIIIGWSSSLRDKIPFWPKQVRYQWIAPSQQVKNNFLIPNEKGVPGIGEHIEEFNEELQNEKEVHEFFLNFTKGWLVEGYQEEYYQLYNQQLIYFVQKFLDYNKVKYIMFNAFEPMLDEKSSLIDYNYYWKEGKESIWSFTKHDDDLLEVKGYTSSDIRHPSKKGHKYFTESLYKFYKEVYDG